MLSAFQAEPIVELRSRDKSKIEAILAHGDQLLVGLSTGSLRIYRVNTPNDIDHDEQNDAPEDGSEGRTKKPFKHTELLREHERFAKYKIEQLAVFKEANILVSLSNGLVSLHDLQTYALQDQLAKTKGCTLFAATSNIVRDPTTNVPSIVSTLAVAVRRRLLLWRWHEGELSEDVEEITLPNTIKSLTWATYTKIVVGLNSNYLLLDVDSKEQKSLVGPGSIGGQPGQETRGTGTLSYIGMGSMIPIPLATALDESEMLLAKDVNTHFIDRDGEPLGRKQVPWKSAPKAVGYSYPYLLSLHELAKGILEVRNPKTLTLLQSIELPSATLLQVPNPNTSLAHQGKGFLVASDRSIWRMRGLSYDDQIDALVEKGALDEAISLLDMIEETLVADKHGRIREIKMQKAQRLFDDAHFQDALYLFSEVSAPPERVIRLYPSLIAGDWAQERPESPLQSPKKKRTESVLSKNSTQDVKKRDTDTSSIFSASPTKNSKTEDKELKAAVRELQAFLADTRRRLQRFFDADQNVKPLSELEEGPQAEDNMKVIEYTLGVADHDEEAIKDRVMYTAMLVDTTLFRAYMYVMPSLAGSLFRITNFCNPDVVMVKLEATERYNDLIDFLYGKKLHRQALERLQKFGQSAETKEIDPQLYGPDRTVSYLQNLSPDLTDLILEFSKWPMEAKPDAGMEIFLADSENAESLPRAEVTSFLETIDQKYAVRYLEHIIDELDDLTPELHHRLAVLYFEKLRASERDPGRDELLDKFQTHLRQSTQYAPHRILALLPRDNPLFYEATALVLHKMHQHRQALQIYVFKLNDTAKAEEYCNQVHLEQSTTASPTPKSTSTPTARKVSGTTDSIALDPTSETSTIYATLLSLYLTPPSPEKPRITNAIDLMARHGPRLPASSTLSMIPSDLLVKELEFYLRGRVRHANSATADTRVEAALRKVHAVRVQCRLLLGEDDMDEDGEDVPKGRRRRVRIDEERVCRVCHKRIGNSVISVFPDDVVVHLGCQGKREAEMSANTNTNTVQSVR